MTELLPPGQPGPRRTRVWIVVGTITTLVLAGAILSFGSRHKATPTTVIASAGPTATSATVVVNPEPSDEPTAAETSAPAQGWTPCDADTFGDGGSKDLLDDPCDGAYATTKENGPGALLDAFIENKDMIDEARLKDCPKFATT